MNQADELHAALVRQLRRLNLDPALSPSPAAWRELLDVLSTTYAETEGERVALKRSTAMSSREIPPFGRSTPTHTTPP